MVARVGALEDTALTSAADDRPRLPLAAPHDSVHHFGTAGLQLDVRRAGAVREEEDLVPRATAIARSIHAALGAWLEGVASRRDVDDVWIRWMHAHRADLPDVAQSDERPAQSRIGGFVHAAPDRHVAADVVRARSDVHDVR